MTVTTNDRGQQNMWAKEPQMFIDPSYTEKYGLETYAERAEKTNGRWAMLGFVSGLLSYAITGNFFFGLGYNKTRFDSETKTAMFGDGNSDTSAKTVGLELSYIVRPLTGLTVSTGMRYNYTKVAGFTDINDKLELTYAQQKFGSTEFIQISP